MRDDDPARTARRLRLWPAALILGAAAVALAIIWLTVDGHRQNNVMLSVPVIALTVLLLILWLLFFSGLRFWHRLLWLLVVLAGFGLLASTVTVRGVSGDLVPVLGWRFSRAPDALPAPGAGMTPPASAGRVRALPDRDYPQYLGPERNATVPGAQLDVDWRGTPPALLWRQPVGAAWSGFAVLGDYVVTQEQRGESELVTCYDLTTGALRWSHADEARHDDPLGGVGPRATPTLEAGRVYAQGATGILNVLDLATGQEIWSTNVLDDASGLPLEYGMSTSPLVLPDRVVVFAGGSDAFLIAYSKESGRVLWKSGESQESYSSPAVFDLAGREQIVVLGREALSAQDPSTGEVLWEHAWPAGAPRAAQPVAIPGDRLLVSGGYGMGSKLLQVTEEAAGPAAAVIWEGRALKAKFANAVYRDGYVYGLDDGILVAVSVDDGQRAWKRGRYGHGQVILAGRVLVVQTEHGAVVLVEATPEEHRELARLDALGSKTWNNPALAGPHLLVRNDREAACYRLPLQP